MILLSFISYTKAAGLLNDRVVETSDLSAERYAQELGGWINGYAGMTETLVADFTTQKIADRSVDDIHKYLEANFDILNADGMLYDIYFVDVNNVMTCASDYVSDGTVDFVHEREYFVNAVATGALCYSTPYKDAYEDTTVITISKEIRDGDELKGVFCTDIYVDTMIDVINQAEVEDDSYAFLTDSHYNMVVHPYEAYYFDDEPFLMTDNLKAELQSVLTQEKSIEEVFSGIDGSASECRTITSGSSKVADIQNERVETILKTMDEMQDTLKELNEKAGEFTM